MENKEAIEVLGAIGSGAFSPDQEDKAVDQAIKALECMDGLNTIYNKYNGKIKNREYIRDSWEAIKEGI